MIPVVFSTDHNYVMPTGITICSLLLHPSSEPYDIYVLEGSDVDENDRKLLRRQVAERSAESRINFIHMGDAFQGSYEIRSISTACYYRLLIPWLLPQYDKIIYSDVDIIFRTGLSEVYHMDLGDSLVAGAATSPGGWRAIEKYIKKLKLDPDQYINSGMLLINAKEQRAENLDKVYKELSTRKFTFQDQDIINLACKDRIAHFDMQYNLSAILYKQKPEFSDRVVIHYAGPKPWREFTWAWDAWWEVYNQSIFKDDAFYYHTMKQIARPKGQVKNLLRRVYMKLQILFRSL